MASTIAPTTASAKAIFSTLMLATLAACGGGGGGAADAATPGMQAALGATAAPTIAAAPTATAASSSTTAASAAVTPVETVTAQPGAAAATVPVPNASTSTNSAAVGTARALGSTANLAVAGVPETPTQTAAPVAVSGGRTFHVNSVLGSDSNNGLASAVASGGAGPWRSLARLMQSDLAAGDSVVLACGSNWHETLRLPVSGTASRPIMIGAPSTGCTSTTRPAIDGSVTLAAAAWTQHSGNIYKATLTEAPLQVLAPTGVLTEAHHPNRGYLPADPTSPYLAMAANGNAVATSTTDQGSTVLTTGADLVLPAGAQLAAGARLRIRTGSWLIDEATVTAVNGNKLTLSPATTYPLVAGWGYYLMGQLWMLDSAGEWFYDSNAKQLYAWMPDSTAPTAGVAVAVQAAGVDLAGRANVVVDGIAVRRVGTGFQMRNSTGVRVQNTLVEDVADRGIDAGGSTGVTLESNVIARVGLDAISGYTTGTGPSSALTVRNNLIRDAGVLMQGEQPVSLPRRSYAAIQAGAGATVTGNAIINAGYVGIRMLSSSTIEDNFVYGACSVLDDCGSIYIWMEHDSNIRRNTVVHARGATSGKPAAQALTAAQGIYLDDGTTGVLVEDNTVIDTDNGIQLHAASSNTVRGNRLYGNRGSQIWMQDGSTNRAATGDVFGNVVTNNQIATIAPRAVGLRLDTPYASASAFAAFDGNRYYDRASSVVANINTATSSLALTLAQWRQSRSVASTQPVDTNGSGVGSKGYATYAISGSNMVNNAALAQDMGGWSSWNQTAPVGQLTREACPAGMCLRYVAGGSPGLISSPTFSVQQGQWYRLSFDLSTEQDMQSVLVVARRNGGNYEVISDRSLAVTAGTTWTRFSIVFQATTTVVTGNPAGGDNGARIDMQNIADGNSLRMANMELVAIAPSTTAQTSGVMVNVSGTASTQTCPLAATQPTLCSKFMNLANDLPVSWPLTVPAHSAVILYGQDSTLVDSDGDGVPDSQDVCPGTLSGAPVNARGCSFAQR